MRLKVSQVVGKTVKLNRRGKEFIGLSPFTTEKTPSFTVSDEKGFYHCFSSGEHGNIFDFLMKTQSIKFGEAVRQLSSQAGMQPYRFSKFDEEKEKRYQSYINILKDFSDYHHETLLKNNSNSMDYLKKRGISRETIIEFKIGYVPDKSDYYDQLLKKYGEKEIFDTGLFYKNEKYNKYINRFYSRVIFPIKNIIGDVIGFGGRIIKEKKTAKYINSPETEFYKKGRHVFNLDKAKSATNKEQEVIIVEGYMDVITIYSSGIKNVVSNSGIALTENQIRIIWKFFSNPIVCLDGDLSGQKAALRIAESLLPNIQENNKIWFVTLSKGMDPDDFLKEKGKEKFQELLTSKVSIEEFIWRIYLNNLDRSDPFASSKFEKKFRNLCKSIKDKTLQKYILENYLEKIRNLTPIQKNSRKTKNIYYRALNETKKISVAKDHLTKEEIKEYSILFIMYNYPKIVYPRTEILSDIKFSSEKLNNLKSDLINLISEDKQQEENLAILKKRHLNLIEDINQNVLIKNIFSKNDEEKQIELLNEILKELNEIKFSKKIENLEKKLIEKFDEESYSDLIKLKSQINKE